MTVTRVERVRRLLPALWAGWQLCVALLATPATFAVLARPDAGRVAGRMLAQEAHTSLALGILVLILERVAARRSAAQGRGSQFSIGMALALGTLFCTICGYFVVEPMMVAARLGQAPLSFGQLHAISAGFFIVKLGLILALAWRASATATVPATSS